MRDKMSVDHISYPLLSASVKIFFGYFGAMHGVINYTPRFDMPSVNYHTVRLNSQAKVE